MHAGIHLHPMETQVSLRLDDDLLRSLDGRARAQETTRSALIRSILVAALEGQVAESATPYDRTRDLIGSVRSGTKRRGRKEQLLDVIQDRRG